MMCPLQAVALFALSSFEQHSAAASCPRLVSAIVQCLASGLDATERQPTKQQQLQDALAAVKALSISAAGQQVGKCCISAVSSAACAPVMLCCWQSALSCCHMLALPVTQDAACVVHQWILVLTGST